MGDIIYPQGCKPITEDLGNDELIRRLKVGIWIALLAWKICETKFFCLNYLKALAHTLQTMGQDEGMYQAYIPLALHLADENFLQHPSRDVQLLIACCIADVLRIFAPEAPYKDVDQVKVFAVQLSLSWTYVTYLKPFSFSIFRAFLIF